MNLPTSSFSIRFKLSLCICVLAQLPFYYLCYDGALYDSSAYTECKTHPEKPLYDGGILKNYVEPANVHLDHSEIGVYSPAFVFSNLTQATKYTFSCWVKIKGANSAHITANLLAENLNDNCTGSVIAKSKCWSFLKGGFSLRSPSNISVIFFQNLDDSDVHISIASASLQPFTEEEWRMNQEYRINTERKRVVTVHVSDRQGNKIPGAKLSIQQISKEFPFGSAMANTIVGNSAYQDWFAKRFNVAVFENELKWDAIEPKQGKVNYTNPDQMLEFARANGIAVRGHNIFWENPAYLPSWVYNLTVNELQVAVTSRIQSLMNKYKEEFIHWDITNEMLHFDFYEQRLGPDATLHFYETVHESDPLVTLFLNDFNVVETCGDVNATVDAFIAKVRELKKGGATMQGIGLESHFSVPNLPLMRSVLDKLATLGLPIWLTEVDIHRTFDKETQAIYLEEVLREGFSHPSVNGIMLWTALHSNGCYRMCLTDNDLVNLPAGDVVDKLLQEWRTKETEGLTDEHGSYSFMGFLGEYNVHVSYQNRSISSTMSLCKGDETKHFSVRM